MAEKAKAKNKSKQKNHRAQQEEPKVKVASMAASDATQACKCNEQTCECGEQKCSEQCQKENKEAVYLEALQRTMAEFDNYRKRTAAASERAKEDGICEAVSKILPSVDALDNAIKMLGDNEQVVSGLKLVKDNILNSFKALGLVEIDALNKPFDPSLHNAISAGEVEGVEEGIVVEEYQKGYKLGNRVVRYTMCRVSK